MACMTSVITTGSVLIVDDETAILEILMRHCRWRGIGVTRLRSGDVAIAMLKDPDV